MNLYAFWLRISGRLVVGPCSWSIANRRLPMGFFSLAMSCRVLCPYSFLVASVVFCHHRVQSLPAVRPKGVKLTISVVQQKPYASPGNRFRFVYLPLMNRL